MELRLPNEQFLLDAWSDVPVTELTEDPVTEELVLLLKSKKIKLPAVPLSAGIRLTGSVRLELAPYIYGVYEVYFTEYVNGEAEGGQYFGVERAFVP